MDLIQVRFLGGPMGGKMREDNEWEERLRIQVDEWEGRTLSHAIGGWKWAYYRLHIAEGRYTYVFEERP